MKPPKSSGRPTPSIVPTQRTAAQHRALDAVLGILDAYEGAGRAAERLVLKPAIPSPDGTQRKRGSKIGFLPPQNEGWPALVMPKKGMIAHPGWGQAQTDPASQGASVAIALFALDATQIASAVEQISAQQRRSESLVPVFLTDTPAHGVFRRKGYTVEYFPAAVYGPDGDLRVFQERLTLAWRKWSVGALIDLSAPGFLRPRIRGLGFAEAKPVRDPESRKWERPAPAMPRAPSPDIAALKAEYASRGLKDVPDSFVLYRIIGNDLYPRHEKGQSLRNVRFIVDNEPDLPGCEKRWIVNRIFDPEHEAEVVSLLERTGQSFTAIPFDRDAYRATDWDFSGFADPDLMVSKSFEAMSPRMRMRVEARVRRLKINYAVNNNGARNFALRDGRTRAKWVLPWDGNCYLTREAWAELTQAVTAEPYLKYFITPMARLVDNDALLQPGFAPEAVEEPQILFRADAEEAFDENYPYGRRPKVEIFWRLGVPGIWDQSRDDVWDLPRTARSEHAGQFGRAGWVARLSSGMVELEATSRMSQVGRELARNEATVATLDDLDAALLRREFDAARLTAYDETQLAALRAAEPGSAIGVWRDKLVAEANSALLRGPYSVVDKTSLPPGGDRHDYWHPAPYWWPNPLTLDGLPYIRRDGERAPGTVLYEPDSDRYDRTRLQRLFDDATILSLAWRATENAAFADHAAKLVRRWFVDGTTRMNPHLQFAQVRAGHEAGEMNGWGVIEMKDMYFFLDAVRLLERSGALEADDLAAFRGWLAAYLAWLRESPQGQAERRSRNNHGVAYDLQVGAIAAYLGEIALLQQTFRDSSGRLLAHFDADGSQPLELTRTQSAHYVCFNLQNWINLATLAGRCGCDLRQVAGADGRSLRRGFEWLLPLLAEAEWPYEQIEPFDRDRRFALALGYRGLFGEQAPGEAISPLPAPRDLPVTYFPHDGVKPFWLLDHATLPDHRASADRIAPAFETEQPEV